MASDNTLELLIKLGVIGREDAEAAKDLLAETRAEAEQFGKTLPASWAGMEKYKEALAGAGGAAEGAGHHFRELNMMMRVGGPAAAEIGHLLHLAFNPAFLAGTALAGGMEAYFHWLDKSLERQKAANEELAKHNDFLREAVKLQGDAYEIANKNRAALAEARAEQNSLTRQLKDFEERAEIFNAAQNDALLNQTERRKEENTLLQEQVTLLETIGRLSKPQAEQDKLSLEHQARIVEIHEKITKARSDYNSAVSDENEELRQAGGRAAFSPESIAVAKDAADKTKAALAQAEFVSGKGGEDELARLRALAASIRRDWNQHGTEWDPATGQLRAVGFRQEYDEVQGQIADQKTKMAAAAAQLDALSAASAGAAQHVKDISSQADKFAGLDHKIAMLGEKVTAATHAAPGEISAENQRAVVQQTAAAIKSGAPPGAIWQHGLSAIDELNHMKEQTGYSPQEWLAGNNAAGIERVHALQAQVAALQNLETAIGNNGAAFIGQINSIIQTMGGHEKAAVALKTYADNISQRLNALTEQVHAAITAHR